MKHKKLFPALTAQNNTTGYPIVFCNPVCPKDCYFPSVPLPPPPPPPPKANLSDSSIFVISSLAIFFLFFCYYCIIGKCINDMQPPAEAENSEEGLQPPAAAENAKEGLDENRVDHPIWFITTIGLQQSVINSIAVFKYKKGEGMIEGTDCSVCLSEFQEDKRLRLLPNCNHAFHISCIDTWLTTHTNCPLCRAIVRDDPVTSPLLGIT